jgi:WD40 repeat protein/DNA-binding winged helix-turn-helix (wHTH) protein
LGNSFHTPELRWQTTWRKVNPAPSPVKEKIPKKFIKAPMPSETNGVFDFHDFHLDSQERLFLYRGERVDLTPKAFNTLLFFVKNSGRLLTKGELMSALWPDSHVAEPNLTVTIRMVRKALGQAQNGNPSENEKPYIETIPKKGYRFVADLSYHGEESRLIQVPHPEEKSQIGLLAPLRQYREWLLIIGIVAAVATILDLALAHPQRVQLLRDVGAALVAVMSLWLYTNTSARPVRNNSGAAQAAAFRGLLSFESTDANRFYGRDIEVAAIVDLITHSEFRFGVLHGDSGCGKTSLLKAAVMPALEAKGYLAVYCRSYSDPVTALVAECQRRSRVNCAKGEAAFDYLRRIGQKTDQGIVVICDQFEEFYINLVAKEQRAPFLQLVSDCHNAFDLPIKFLFGIRSDFLYLIAAAFDEWVPETLLASKRYHLQNFDEDQAAEVIERSVQRANWPFEPGLSHKIARELSVRGTVLPSELQIVGEQLQNNRIFTLEQYRSAGGREQLVHSYLEDVLKMASDQQAAQLVLRCLISDEDTRLTLPVAEIEKRVQRSPKTIASILDLFVKMRLIHEIQDEGPWRYELMHEYLIERINQTTGKVMDATQRANRYLRQYLSGYVADKSTRIPITRLWFIRRYSDLQNDERQRELMKKSLVRGLLQAAISAVLLSALVVSTAAWLSVTESWEGIRLADGHTDAVHRAVFSPDGRLLVSCGEDGKVIVWDFARRQRIATLLGHTGWVNALAFSPDGKWFATGGYDHKVIVWNAVTFKIRSILTEHNGIIGGLAFSPDGRLMASSASGSKPQTILWDTGRWEKEFEIPAMTSDFGATLFAKNDIFLFPSRSSAWDLTTQHPSPGFNSAWGGTWAALSPDNRFMVALDAGGQVRFVDLIRNELLAEYKVHQDNGRAVAYSPNGLLVATGAENIILWDAITRRKIVSLSYPSSIWSLAFSPDGRWLVSTHGDGSILVWDPTEHQLIANLNEHSGAVRAVAYSHDGKHIASGGEDDSVIIWNIETKQKEAVLIGHKNKVVAVAFLPDGSLVSTAWDGETISWDVSRRTPKWKAQDQSNDLCLTVSPDGRWVVTREAVYSSTDGKIVAQISVYSWSTTFSSDGRWLIYQSTTTGHLAVRDTRDWRIIDDQDGAKSDIVAVSSSPDSKFVVTGEDEGNVRLWQLNPLRELAALGRHSARVKSVAFSPDGKQVASAGDDHVINLWDVRGRRLVTQIGTHAAPVLSIAFSPDGKHLVSGEHDNSVRLYTRHRSLWGHQLD